MLGLLVFVLLPLLSAYVDRGPSLPGAAQEILGGYVALTVSLFVLSVCVRRAAAPDDREWLVALCRAALLLRALVAIVVFFGPWDFYLLGDDQIGYDYIPITIANYWNGVIPQLPLLSEPAYQERKGYFLLVSAQYYLLGPSFMMPRLLNCLAGALIVLYSYRLARHVFGRTEAKVAAVWTAFFPSLVLWSTLNLRDIWLALSVVVVIYHALLMRERLTLSSALTVALTLAWVQYNRFPLVLILLGAMGSALFLARAQRFKRDLFVAFLFLGVIIFLQQGLGLGREAVEWLDLRRIGEHRGKIAQASVGASGYLGDVDLTNPAVIVTFVPVSLAYFLFSPFPWQMTAPRRLITLPEMLVWYWSAPFGILAARDVLRERTGRRLALLLPTLMVTFAFAISSSNIGLSYRYRAQVIALYLAFAAAGFVQRRRPDLALRGS